MRKGDISLAARAMLVLLLSMMLISVAMLTTQSVKDLIRVETTDIVGSRIGNAIYATSALERGRTQLNFQEEYGIKTEDGQPYVNYTVGKFALKTANTTGLARIKSPVDFTVETGKSDSFCLINDGTGPIELEQGECVQ